MKTPLGPYAGETWIDYWGDDKSPMDPVCECGWPGFLCDQRWHEEREPEFYGGEPEIDMTSP